MVSRLEIPVWGWQGGLLCAGAAIGVLTGIDPKLGLLAAIGLCFVGLVLADLTIGLAIFVFITFLDVLAIAPGLGITKLFGALLALSWLAKLATTPRALRTNFLSDNAGLSYIVLAFLTWVALSALWAEFPDSTGDALLRFGLNVLLLPIVYAAVRRRRDLVLVLSAFVLGAIASGLFGAMSGVGGRLWGATVEANELAATLVAGVGLAGGGRA